MPTRDEFLDQVLPRFKVAERALHNGDAGPRIAMWSQTDPTTVFGAAVSKTGWAEIRPMFEWLASSFSDCTAYDVEVISAEAGSDYGYMVAIEHTTASVAGEPSRPYALRVTTVFRREGDEWKIVHRHGDPIDDSAAALMVGLQGSDPP